MAVKNDGGPAFPVPAETWNFTGMSLRDYFAAKALTGMLAYSINNSYNQANGTLEDIAKGAYNFADAMLKARGEK